MNSAILLAFFSMILWGTSNFTVKKLADKIGTLSTVFYKFIPHMLILGIFFAVQGLSIPHGIAWLWIIVYGVLGAIGYYSFVKSIEVGTVSLDVPIANSSILITVILSTIFLGEILTLTQYIAIGVIVMGVIFISLHYDALTKGKLRFRMSIWYSLVTLVCWGIIYTVMKIIVTLLGPIAAAFYQELSVFIVISILYLSTCPKFLDNRILEKNNLLILCGAALVSAGGTILEMLAVSQEKVSIVVSIISASPLVTFILAILFLREKVNRYQVAAVFGIVIGIIILGAAG
jgi:bacterial/archaeal transporter family protein